MMTDVAHKFQASETMNLCPGLIVKAVLATMRTSGAAMAGRT